MELLINLRAHVKPDEFHRGDMVVAMPDGHAWTRLEMERTDWVVLRAPVLATHADMMGIPVTEERAGDPGPRLVLHRRHRFDVDRIPQLLGRKVRLDRVIDVSRSLLESVTLDKGASA